MLSRSLRTTLVSVAAALAAATTAAAVTGSPSDDRRGPECPTNATGASCEAPDSSS